MKGVLRTLRLLFCVADQGSKASPSAEASPSTASTGEQQRGARFEELKAQSTGNRAARADKPKRASFRDVVRPL